MMLKRSVKLPDTEIPVTPQDIRNYLKQYYADIL